MTDADFAAHASSAGLDHESWPEGTIRLSLGQDARGADIPLGEIPDMPDSQFVLAYRENRRDCRFALCSTWEGLITHLRDALASAWSVDDDLYVFPTSGDYLLYLSHHDGLTLYTPNPNKHVQPNPKPPTV